jgi:hypothetical protein
MEARQSSELQDGVRLLGGVLENKHIVPGVCRIARDFAEIEDY